MDKCPGGSECGVVSEQVTWTAYKACPAHATWVDLMMALTYE